MKPLILVGAGPPNRAAPIGSVYIDTNNNKDPVWFSVKGSKANTITWIQKAP